ncbi:hypothetical protein DPMN_127986 [Dreissena polymorpha]|uniref:Uncharacterized protein n=1 Tax=Dreissena polymorpha TaxID=45954 RepID=A0A9D4H290_DREPO|nr:hypothetical protein DPMN_127986 [Dreissena polymorpha]
MGMEKFYMYAQLYESKRRFQRACDQIAFLYGRLDDFNKRYKRAIQNEDKCFRYKLRMRILVADGLLQTYCQYTCLKKNEVLDLRLKLNGENPDEGETLYAGIEEYDDAADVANESAEES